MNIAQSVHHTELFHNGISYTVEPPVSLPEDTPAELSNALGLIHARSVQGNPTEYAAEAQSRLRGGNAAHIARLAGAMIGHEHTFVPTDDPDGATKLVEIVYEADQAYRVEPPMRVPVDAEPSLFDLWGIVRVDSGARTGTLKPEYASMSVAAIQRHLQARGETAVTELYDHDTPEVSRQKYADEMRARNKGRSPEETARRVTNHLEGIATITVA